MLAGILLGGRVELPSYLCVFQELLLDALLQLSSCLRVAAHGDDDFDGIVVTQAR